MFSFLKAQQSRLFIPYMFASPSIFLAPVALLSLSDPSLPSAKSVVFSENTATSSGGALSTWEAGLLKINDTRFASNTAEFGGAVFIGSAQAVQAEFSGCIFEDNTAVDGGAVFLHTTPAGGGRFTASVFRGNLAGKWLSGAQGHIYATKQCSTQFCCGSSPVHRKIVKKRTRDPMN